jgi:hypothetical protein
MCRGVFSYTSMYVWEGGMDGWILMYFVYVCILIYIFLCILCMYVAMYARIYVLDSERDRDLL